MSYQSAPGGMSQERTMASPSEGASARLGFDFSLTYYPDGFSLKTAVQRIVLVASVYIAVVLIALLIAYVIAYAALSPTAFYSGITKMERLVFELVVLIILLRSWSASRFVVAGLSSRPKRNSDDRSE